MTATTQELSVTEGDDNRKRPTTSRRRRATLDDWSLAELHVLESRVSAALAASQNVVVRVKHALRPPIDATPHPFRARHRELLAAVGALPLEDVPRDDLDHDGGDDNMEKMDAKRRKQLVIDWPAWRRQHFGECADTRLALKRSAFERLFVALQRVPRRALLRIFQAFDANDSGRVEFVELCDALVRLRRRSHADARDERVESVFRWFTDRGASVMTHEDIELLQETYQALVSTSSASATSVRGVLLANGTTSLSLQEFRRRMKALPHVITTLVAPFTIVDDLVQEQHVLKDVAALRWHEGDTAYVVSKSWWDAWTHWITADTYASKEPSGESSSTPERPGPIDNAVLCSNAVLGILLPHIAVDHDVVIISGKIWRKLHALYGGGPELPRKIVGSAEAWSVDLHPRILSIRVLKTDSVQTSLLLARRVQLSEATDMTAQALLRRLGLAPGVNIRDAVLWYRRRRLDTWRRLRCSTTGSAIASSADGDILLSALGLENGDEVLIDFRPLESSDDETGTSTPPSFVPDNRLFFRLYRPMGNDFVSLTSGIECGLTSASRWNAQPLAGIDTDDALMSDSASAAAKAKMPQTGSMQLYVGGHGGLGGHGNVMVSIDPELTRPKDPARLATHFGVRATGLLNLGNTCFINCALQCIGHSPLFREYMLSRRFFEDINKANPLGTKGKIAMAYGKLMELLWGQTGEDMSCFAPTTFRDEFLKYRPMFQESNQHDSHEFIVSLLDALHEDLNRREDYSQRHSYGLSRRARSSQLCLTEVSLTTATSGAIDGLDDDDEGWGSLDSSCSSTLPLSSDATLGSMSWQAHARRNASVVVDLFHGQMRSETVCASCDARKVTFDPFVYFSVPIPEPKWIRLEVKIVFMIHSPTDSPEASSDGDNNSNDTPWWSSITPVICRGFWLPRQSTISALFDAIAEAYHLPPVRNRFVLAEVRRCRIARLFDEVDRVQTLGSNLELFAFERATSIHDALAAPSFLKIQDEPEPSPTMPRVRRFDDLMIGTRVDATTVDGVWYPATVVNDTNAGEDPSARRVMVHFDGLDVTWDTWFSEPDWRDGKLAPLHTQTKKEAKLLEVQVVMRLVTTQRRAIPMRDESQQPKVGARNVMSKKEEASQNVVTLEVFGSPMFITLSSASTTRDLHATILTQATRFMTHAFVPGIMDESLLPFDARLLSVDTIGSSLGEKLPNDDTGIMQHLNPKSVIVLDWRKYTDYSYFEQPSRDYVPKVYAKQLLLDQSDDASADTMRPTSTNDAVMLDNSTSLPKCLDELFKREIIEHDDMWMCERCGDQRTGTRQADVWKLPDLVMIQLKRFQYHESGYREKIRTMVDCPLNGLDFSPWVGTASDSNSESCVYDLYAVVNHVGGLARGHYTAYCRYDSDFEETSRMFTSLDRDRERSAAEMPFTDMWLRFDDEKVVEIAPGDVISDAAYVLFYKRRKLSSRNVLAYSF